MEKLFYSLIQYLCVPSILLMYFLFSLLMVNLTPRHRPDTKGPARWIAFFLSLTIFLLVGSMLHTLSLMIRNEHLILVFDLAVVIAILGMLFGVIFCLVAYFLVNIDLTEILVLVMTTLSLVWFYFYFIETWMREIVVMLAIGQLAGILTCALLFAQRLPAIGLVWVCNHCGNHNFIFAPNCRCGQAQSANP